MSDKVEIRVLEPQIIENRIKEGVEISAEDVKSIKKENTRLAEGKNYGVLIKAQPFLSVSKEAMEVNASKEYQNLTRANALLIDGLPQRILGSFYIKFKKPAIKTKLFNDREKAIEWLRRELGK